MGSIVGKAMDENMKKQQEFMLESQITVMERQIQMQNQMREKQMAMMMARSRDIFLYYSSFYAVAVLGGLAGFFKAKKPGAIVPLIPLTWIFVYQYDLSYGPKMKRLLEEADRILDEEPDLLKLPHNLPTLKTIEAARQALKKSQS